VILKSRTLSRTSDTTETRNPCVIKVIYILIYLISSDILTRIFVSTRKLTFWDFVRNDNPNKGATARLNKSSPIYLGPKNLDTFWCTGWAWNCQIIFRCASIHGRAGFILVILRKNINNKHVLTTMLTSLKNWSTRLNSIKVTVHCQ
jgi:hypothetical protein